MKKVNFGDVYERETKTGLVYLHDKIKDEKIGELYRVLSSKFRERPIDLNELELKAEKKGNKMWIVLGILIVLGACSNSDKKSCQSQGSTKDSNNTLIYIVDCNIQLENVKKLLNRNNIYVEFSRSNDNRYDHRLTELLQKIYGFHIIPSIDKCPMVVDLTLKTIKLRFGANFLDSLYELAMSIDTLKQQRYYSLDGYPRSIDLQPSYPGGEWKYGSFKLMKVDSNLIFDKKLPVAVKYLLWIDTFGNVYKRKKTLSYSDEVDSIAEQRLGEILQYTPAYIKIDGKYKKTNSVIEIEFSNVRKRYRVSYDDVIY